MPHDPPHDEPTADDLRLSLTQLRAIQYGVAGSVMPVSGGWRVIYFSLPDFEQEEGTDFPSLDEALAGMAEILSMVNSDEEKARVRGQLHARLRETHEESRDDDPV